MKKNSIIALIILVVTLVSFSGCSSKNRDDSKSWYKNNPLLEIGTDSYDFSMLPEYPNDATVSRLTYYDVPQDTVDSMSTQGLLKTCLDYPYSVNLVAYDTSKIGYHVVKSQFRPLAALVERQDAPEILASFYSSFTYSDAYYSDYDALFSIKMLEMIISDDVIVEKYDSASRKAIVKQGINNIVENSEELDSYFFLSDTLHMVSKVLYYDCQEFKELADSDARIKSFVTGEAEYLDAEVDEEALSKIIDMATDYMN